MLSNSCLVFTAVVKQQQEEISHNHVPSLFAVSVHFCFCSEVLGLPVNERRAASPRGVKKELGLQIGPLWRSRRVEGAAPFERHKRQSGPYLSPKSIPLSIPSSNIVIRVVSETSTPLNITQQQRTESRVSQKVPH